VELWELGWRGQGAVVTYLKCPRCDKGGCYAEDDREQGVVPYWRREKISWYGCKEKEEQSGARARDSRSTAKEEKAAWPREVKAQQSGARSGEPESAARKGGSQQEVRRTFKMLREVWLNIGIEKIDTHEGVMIKALLDNGATGMFIDRQTAARHGFKLQKLERPLVIRNVDGTNNSGGAITHQVECNVFYKGHMERMRMDVCNLGKTEVILGMPWLAAHNPEINWETGEIKMMRCPPLCGRKGQKSGDRGRRENRPVGNRRQRRLGKRGRDRRGPQENRGDGPKEVFEVEKSVWESGVKENAKEKDLGSCYRSQEDV